MSSPIDRKRFDSVVVALLGPVVGASMAQAAVDGHCRSLKIQGPSLGAGHQEALIHRLQQGMNVFVGPEKASSLAAALRRELDDESRAPEGRPAP